jgi:hypothetical protein
MIAGIMICQIMISRITPSLPVWLQVFRQVFRQIFGQAFRRSLYPNSTM